MLGCCGKDDQSGHLAVLMISSLGGPRFLLHVAPTQICEAYGLECAGEPEAGMQGGHWRVSPRELLDREAQTFLQLCFPVSLSVTVALDSTAVSYVPPRLQPLGTLYFQTFMQLLTPLHNSGIDLCNHQFGEAANCEIRPTASGVRLVTQRAVEAGEECFINYGALPNDFLLLD